MDNVIQVRLSTDLKHRLDRIADRMEIPMSTLIRSVLATFSRKPHAVRLTANGFTIEEEDRLLSSIKQAEKEIRQNKAKVFDTIDDALSYLEKTSKK